MNVSRILNLNVSAFFSANRENHSKDTIEKLVALPGIGPKMGYLALQCAWGKNDGIGVDVHVHRICQRLNWTIKVSFQIFVKTCLENLINPF